MSTEEEETFRSDYFSEGLTPPPSSNVGGGEYLRVRPVSNNSSGSESCGSSPLVDCRLGRDEQTGLQQVEMIFSLNSFLMESNGNGTVNDPSDDLLSMSLVDSDFLGAAAHTTEEVNVCQEGWQSRSKPGRIGSVTCSSSVTPGYESFDQSCVDHSQGVAGSLDPKTNRSNHLPEDLKLRLTHYRELLVHISEKLRVDRDVGRTAGSLIVIFTILFLFHYVVRRQLELTAVTCGALLALGFGLVDYFSGYIYALLRDYKRKDTREWTLKDSECFDAVCSRLSAVINHTQQIAEDWSRLRREKSKLAYFTLILSLLVLAWFGTVFDDILLLYLLGVPKEKPLSLEDWPPVPQISQQTALPLE